jgi:transposase
MESVSEQTFVGLDVHRKSVVATALDADGSRVSQERFGATDAELTDYLGRLPGRKHIVLEACALWEHFYDAAQATGASVVLSNPYRTRLIAEASLKTDKLDSQALARLLRLDSIPESYAPPPEVRALRNLVRERIFYRREAASIKNHVYSALLRRGIEYEDQILNLHRRREGLRDLSIVEVDRGLYSLSSLEATCRQLDHAIHEAWASSQEAQLLTTISGVGELIALALVAFLCPIERFSSVDKLSSYVGLVPTTHQSGESEYHGHLKKDSIALLRWLLVEASWQHRRRWPRGTVAKVARRVSRRRGKGKGSVAGPTRSRRWSSQC